MSCVGQQVTLWLIQETCKRLFELAELQSRNLTNLAETVEATHNSLASIHNALVETVSAYVPTRESA